MRPLHLLATPRGKEASAHVKLGGNRSANETPFTAHLSLFFFFFCTAACFGLVTMMLFADACAVKSGEFCVLLPQRINKSTVAGK